MEEQKKTVFQDVGVAIFGSFVLALLSLAVRDLTVAANDLHGLADSLHRIADQLSK